MFSLLKLCVSATQWVVDGDCVGFISVGENTLQIQNYIFINYLKRTITYYKSNLNVRKNVNKQTLILVGWEFD